MTNAVAQARPHRLSDAALAALGAGRAGPDIIAELRRSQFSRHLLLLREIAATVGPGHLAALTAADRSHPSSVRRELTNPLFGVWAAGCLGALRAGAAPAEAGIRHLDELAAAALLPRPRHDPRRLTATHEGLTLSVRLEDRDPHRAGLGLSPCPPLDAAAVARWQRTLDEAWRLLVTRVRAEAEALATVVTCIVPVEPDPAARGISATSADAFGAVAMSEPADATALAAGLLHESQHSVLNAVLYLFDLLEEPRTRGYSPWRDDPRPASGILHGAYAYLTVTRFWRTQRDSDLAAFEFARWRSAVVAAATDLRDLTPAGARFVGALLDEVRPWLADPVPPRVQRLADSANRDHHLRWRLRNRRVEAADAELLARAWRRGDSPATVTSRLVPAPRRALEASARLDLTHALLRGEAVVGGGADADYVRGDAGAALTAYRQNPIDWPGLLLAAGLTTAPEVVAAVHAALDDGTDPLALARWLA